MPRLRDNSVPTIFPKSENQNLSTTGNIGKTNVSSKSALVSSQLSHQIEETAWDKVVQNKIKRLKEKFIKQRQKIKCLNEKVRRRNIEIAKFQDIIRKDLKIRNRINMEQAALMEELAGGENVATKSASIFEDTSKTIEQPVASSSSALIVKSQSKSENKKDTKNVLLEQCDVQIDCQPSTSNTLATKVTGDIREDFIEEEFLEDYFEDDFVQPPANTGSAGEAPGSVEVAGSVEVEVCEGEFSWQRPAAVVPCDVDDAEWLSDEVVMFEPPSKPTAAVTEPALEPEPEPCHEGYRCNNCGGDIVGFRYVCVQCVDYDLCCTCEAAAAHAVHYVLRVPGPRPHSEVAAVLTTIRRALLADSILLVDGFQAEVKEEPDQPDPISLEAAVEDQSHDGDDITSQDGDDIASQDGDDITSQDGDEGSVASEDSYHPSGDDNSDTDEQVTAHSSASRPVSRTSSRTTTHMPKISLVPQNSLMTTTSSIIKTTPSPKTVPMIKISSPKTTAMTESTPMSKPICYLDLTNNTIVVLGNKKPNISPETLRSHMSAQLRNLPQCTDESRVAERNLPQSTDKSRVAERNLPQSTENSKTAEKRPMPVPVQVNKSVIQAVLSAKRARVNVERLDPAQLNSALDKR